MAKFVITERHRDHFEWINVDKIITVTSTATTVQDGLVDHHFGWIVICELDNNQKKKFYFRSQCEADCFLKELMGSRS